MTYYIDQDELRVASLSVAEEFLKKAMSAFLSQETFIFKDITPTLEKMFIVKSPRFAKEAELFLLSGRYEEPDQLNDDAAGVGGNWSIQARAAFVRLFFSAQTSNIEEHGDYSLKRYLERSLSKNSAWVEKLKENQEEIKAWTKKEIKSIEEQKNKRGFGPFSALLEDLEKHLQKENVLKKLSNPPVALTRITATEEEVSDFLNHAWKEACYDALDALRYEEDKGFNSPADRRGPRVDFLEQIRARRTKEDGEPAGRKRSSWGPC